MGAIAAGADVAVVELDLQRIEALGWVKRARAAGSTTAVVLVSPYDDESLVRLTFGVGARGIILRSRALEDVVAAVDVVGIGSSFVAGAAEDLRQLSPTEARVLVLLGDGLTSAEVGLRLGFCTRTAQSYRASVGRKLGLGGAPRVVAFAGEHRARLKRFLRPHP